MAGEVHLMYGPAGWSYRDWIGEVYPQRVPKGFNHLAYLAEIHGMDFVEVNTSFYHIPSAALSRGWVEKTAHLPRFRFWLKLHQDFTHRAPLGPDLRPSAAPGSDDAFKRALEPIAEAGKLSGILIQFPYSFHAGARERGYLEVLRGIFGSYPLAVEFRHRSWDCPEVLRYFREAGLIWVNIDQPVISQSLPLTAYAEAGETAYLRLHGRNYREWFGESGRDARYDYNYPTGELAQISETLKRLAEMAKKVFISGNNHYKGSAIQNMKQLKALMESKGWTVPQGFGSGS